MTQPSATINYQAFSAPVSRQEALRYMLSSQNSVAMIVFAAVFGMFFILPIIFGGFIFLLLFKSVLLILVFIVGIILLICGIAYAIYAIALSFAGQKVRLVRFAQDNGFIFTDSVSGVESGIFANIGHSQRYNNRLAATINQRTIVISNYQYTTGSGKNSQTHTVGIVELTLPHNLPNILLDSKANNYGSFDSLSQFVSGSQKLSLEGNFDSYFTLYTPKNYERDSLYFLTPELMQLLVSQGQNFDIEIVDNKLKLYIKGGVTYTEQGLKSLFAIIDSLGGEFIENTQHYTDTTSTAKGFVAPAGQRLSRNRWQSIVGIIIFIIVVAIQYFIFFRS